MDFSEKIFMKKGMIIAFLGCDGSGKSTVLEGVKEHLANQDVEYRSFHWRPFYIGGGKSVSSAVVNDPHSQPPHGRIKSIVKLMYLSVDWWLAWMFMLSPLKKKGCVVLFDRWHSDLVSDSRRYRYGGPRWIAKLWDRLLPDPDYLLFMDAEPDVLLSRKQEVGKEVLIQSRATYLKIVQSHKNGVVVDASQPIEVVINKVLRITGLNE